MERGLELLFFVAVMLLAGLLDAVVRWLKGRAERDRPPAVDGEPVVVEDDDRGLVERPWVEPELLPAPPAAARFSPASTQPEAPPPRPPRLPPPPGRRRRRGGRWLRHAAEARRGMVLMAILGPCRGLETPRRD